MRPFWILLMTTVPLALTACGGGTGPVEATAPTVSYAYSTDDEYTEAKDKAEDYCDDNYDKEPVLVDTDGEGNLREVTFACR